MHYLALIRKLNAGSEHRISKQDLTQLMQAAGLAQIEIYLNSGNVLFSATADPASLHHAIEQALSTHFADPIQVLLLNHHAFAAIADAIPADWHNDEEQRSDVAFLFDPLNHPGIIEQVPFDRRYITVKYIDHALIWNVVRANYHRSKLNKLIGDPIYQRVTVRNVTTVRELQARLQKRV